MFCFITQLKKQRPRDPPKAVSQTLAGKQWELGSPDSPSDVFPITLFFIPFGLIFKSLLLVHKNPTSLLIT